jgi:pimeloyl-ACP methyl ester carboxylesterase
MAARFNSPRERWWVLIVLLLVLQLRAQSSWTDRSPHKSEFITVNNVKLQYLDWGGRGETMLLLHGLGDTPHIYDDFAPKFTNKFRVLGLARRGHGQSEIPEDGYDTANRVEDIRQFLDALKIRRAVLIGHSTGGGELTMMGGRHPDRVIKLVYLDAVYDTDRRLEMSCRAPPELGPGNTGLTLDGLRRWLQEMNDGWSEAWEATLREHFSADQKTFLNSGKRNRAIALMSAEGAEAQQDYTKIKAPVLNITVIGFPTTMIQHCNALPQPSRNAVKDFQEFVSKSKEKEIERFRKELPGAKVIVLTNADHHCFIDRQDEVVREIRSFLLK